MCTGTHANSSSKTCTLSADAASLLCSLQRCLLLTWPLFLCSQATNTNFHYSGSTGSFTESDVRVLPVAEYLKANDLITHGEGPNDVVPDPCQTFDSARFPSDLLDEVRFESSSPSGA